ncbi:MAG: ABC transporter substrate-binding protein, partial [Pseudomonadota bacterium]
SLLATGYYNATTAAMTCVNEVGGDLSDGHAAFRQCLTNLELDAPNGKIVLDGNRQAIGTNFVSEVVELDDGTLVTQLVSMKDGVNQTLGIDPDAFAKIGLPSRENPECKAQY